MITAIGIGIAVFGLIFMLFLVYVSGKDTAKSRQTKVDNVVLKRQRDIKRSYSSSAASKRLRRFRK